MYYILYKNIDQKLVNSLHGLLNCEIGGFHCPVITTEYKTRVQCIYMYHHVTMRWFQVNIRIQYVVTET